MLDWDALESFVRPYYADKDIMHNLWHIELVKRMADRILSVGNYKINEEHLILALYFHGFIYRDEETIRAWLKKQQYSPEAMEHIVKIAWESQRKEVPETLEGKILHDAHVLEGGKAYCVVKTLITGSVRGQSPEQTLRFMEKNVLGKNQCYLPETIPLCEEMNAYTQQFYYDISSGIA